MKNKQNFEENAGYLIFKKENYCKQYGICIGANKNGFVTWHYANFENAPTSYFWGHYFSNKQQAMYDYHTRLAREYESLGEQYEEES